MLQWLPLLILHSGATVASFANAANGGPIVAHTANTNGTVAEVAIANSGALPLEWRCHSGLHC